LQFNATQAERKEGQKSPSPVQVLDVKPSITHRIFDNLLAEGRIKEMLVLMHRSDVLLSGGTRADNLRIFEPLLLTEVLPSRNGIVRCANHSSGPLPVFR